MSALKAKCNSHHTHTELLNPNATENQFRREWRLFWPILQRNIHFSGTI